MGLFLDSGGRDKVFSMQGTLPLRAACYLVLFVPCNIYSRSNVIEIPITSLPSTTIISPHWRLCLQIPSFPPPLFPSSSPPLSSPSISSPTSVPGVYSLYSCLFTTTKAPFPYRLQAKRWACEGIARWSMIFIYLNFSSTSLLREVFCT